MQRYTVISSDCHAGAPASVYRKYLDERYREEYDHWIDLPEDLNAHLWTIAQRVGKAIQAEFAPARVGVLVVGEEVPHVHVHVTGFDVVGQLNFANVRRDVTPDEFDDWQRRLANRLGR